MKSYSAAIENRVGSVFGMAKGMAIRAEHFKIGDVIVSVVPILVMYTKDFLNFAISTCMTSLHHSSSEHCLSETRHPLQRCQRFFQFPLVPAFSGAKNSVLRRRFEKWLEAHPACNGYGTPSFHRSTVAFAGAILSKRRTKLDDGELLSTYTAMGDRRSTHEPFGVTSLAAKIRDFQSVLWNVIQRLTLLALFLLSCLGFRPYYPFGVEMFSSARAGAEAVLSVLSLVWMKVCPALLANHNYIGEYPRWRFVHGTS